MASPSPFELVVIAVDRYEDDGWGELAGVGRAPQALHERLGPCGAIGEPLTPDDHRAATVQAFLNDWSSEERAAASAFVYWAGHGESSGARHQLITAEARNPPREGDGVTAQELAKYLLADARRRDRMAGDGETPWTVLVLDCCGAATAVANLAHELSANPEDEPRALALVQTRGDSSQYDGRFELALAATIDRYMENDADIPLLSLLTDIAARLGADADVRPIGLVTCDPRIANPRHVPGRLSATLDVRDELNVVLDGLDPALRTHFVPKAQGAELGELAWYFTGRDAEIERIVGWLRADTGGMLVVTGAAGAGKSALLGRIVTLAEPAVVDALTRTGRLGEVPAAQRPPDGAFEAVVHLSGLSLADAVAQLAASLTPETPIGGAGELIETLRTAAAEPGRPSPRAAPERRRTVLFDALDEARDPLAIAADVLAPLARTAGMRVIVGTRRSRHERVDAPPIKDRDLLDALAVSDRDTLVLHEDPDAIAGYVAARLTRSTGSPYAADTAGAVRLARDIAARAQPFLFARLAISELLARAPLMPGRELDQLLAGGHQGVFRAACTRLATTAPAAPALLHALAFGLGRGLPVHDDVWTTATNALHPDTTIRPEDVDAVLQHAAAYIALDGEDGQSTYRLAHQTFAEHFGVGIDDGRARDAHAAITTGLLRHTRRALDDAATGWPRANAYITTRTAEHAARGATLEQLLDDTDALDHVDQQRLAGELARYYLTNTDTPATAIVSVRHRDELAALAPARRASLRALTLMQIGASAPQPPAHARIWPRWSTAATNTARITLRGHTSGVCGVAFGMVDGRTVLASAGDDGTVRLWDPVAGRTLGEPLYGDPRGVLRVAFGTLEGRAVLAFAGYNGKVWLWDPATGRALGDRLIGHWGMVNGVAFGTLKGRTVLASGGSDMTVRLWDPLAGRALGECLHGHTREVSGVAFGTLEGRTVLASASHDGTVRQWDPVAGRALGNPLSGHCGRVNSVVFGTIEGRTVLASAGDDRTVRLWDPVTGRALGKPLPGHCGGVKGVAFGTLEGRTVLASASDDRTLRLWDPLAGRALGHPLHGHTRGVNEVVFGTLDGRAVLASAGSDETVRLWDPLAARVPGDPLPGHIGQVNGLAFGLLEGRTVLASAGADETVRLWDPVAGLALRKPLYGHTGRVNGVAFATINRRTLLASAGADDTVRLWDPVAGRALGEPLHGHTLGVNDVAFGTLEGRMVLASASTDGTVRLWDPLSAGLLGDPLHGHRGAIHGLAFGDA